MKTIKISEIDWGDRARKDYGDIDSLAASIKEIGLISPIAIEEPNKLRAGGRRITAFIQLEIDEIPYVSFKDLSELHKILIELEENIQRKGLTWQEEARLKLKVNNVKKQIATDAGEKWNSEDTAKVFNVSPTNVRKEIELAKAIDRDPELAKEKDKTTALTKLRRKNEATMRSIEASSADIHDEVYNGDAIENMERLPSNSIDLILFDPPFAENYDKKAGKAGWDEVYGDVEDTEDEIFPLVVGVLKEASRVLKDGAHMYMFFSIRPKKFHELAMFIKDAGLNFQQQPLFWIKPSNQNFDPYHRFTVNYEPFFFIWKGSKCRDLTAQSISTFEFPIPANKAHPAEKPRGLYEELVKLSTHDGEVVLDPTAGSGISLVAAKGINRKVIGVELSKEWFNLIKINLQKEGL